MHLVVRGVHQERQGYLERIVYFGVVDAQLEAGRYPRATVGRMRNPKPVAYRSR